MHALKITTLCLFAALIAAAPALADEKLDKIEKQIIAKYKDLKSMSYKTEMTMDVEQPGMKMQNKITGTFECMRKGEKWLTRTEEDRETIMDAGGQKNTMTGKTLSVCDGEYTYSLSEQMGQKTCSKTDAGEEPKFGEEMFKPLHEHYNVAAGEDTTVAGDKCWVILVTPKSSMPGQPVKMVFHYRQKDGMTLLMVGYDASDKEIMKTTYTDIKVNEKIDPERFVFKAPEGVQVMDMTNTP